MATVELTDEEHAAVTAAVRRSVSNLIRPPRPNRSPRATQQHPARQSSMVDPVRALVALVFLALLASSARAEVYTNAFLRAEVASVKLSDDKTTLTLSLAVDNTTAGPYPIVFLSAALKDDLGNFFAPASRPTGIPTGEPFNCKQGTVLAPGAHLIIVFAFRLPSRAMLNNPSLTLSAEFQAQRSACENFTISLSNLGVARD
jgi:hypothetical protein